MKKGQRSEIIKTDVFTLACKSELGLYVEREYIFHDVRMWRFDYAIIKYKIAIEVEGGAFKKRTYVNKKGENITTIGGRHNSSLGFLNDMEKYNSAAVLGWKVLRTIPSKLLSDETFNMIKEAINNETKASDKAVE